MQNAPEMTGLAQPREPNPRNLERVESVSDLRARVRAWQSAGERVALVPTMGNLHDGHLSLVATASRHAERIVTSIFVNPTQFGVGEDFDSYPRTPARDESLLRRQGLTEILFAPSVAEIYPSGTADSVALSLPPLAADLCGRSRPGHFNGVASVVLRLLNVVAPEVLVMGRKDYQQLVLLAQMIDDLHLDVALVSSATVREDDGLAMSSRNNYLTAAEREVAPRLFANLTALAASLRTADTDFDQLREAAIADLERSGFAVEYLELRDAENLDAVNVHDASRERVLVAAVRLGKARLIDNVAV